MLTLTFTPGQLDRVLNALDHYLDYLGDRGAKDYTPEEHAREIAGVVQALRVIRLALKGLDLDAAGEAAEK